MKQNTYLLCCLILFVTSCKTTQLQQLTQSVTTQKISLGSIGLDKDFILQKGFNSAAIPIYKKGIKVAVSVLPFTKQTYKLFLKANQSQGEKVSFTYVDSLPTKPQFVELQIADKVALIDALNEHNNQSVKNYLEHNSSANIVISTSVAFNKQDLVKLQEADAVFLEENGSKMYVLQLYRSGSKTDMIHFNEGVVFTFKAASCCWQENSRHQLNIVDLVNQFNSCPNKTYLRASRAKKTINYFKL